MARNVGGSWSGWLTCSLLCQARDKWQMRAPGAKGFRLRIISGFGLHYLGSKGHLEVLRRHNGAHPVHETEVLALYGGKPVVNVKIIAVVNIKTMAVHSLNNAAAQLPNLTHRSTSCIWRLRSTLRPKSALAHWHARGGKAGWLT
jgi:hypothetical protein